jgi:hypothetical protein
VSAYDESEELLVHKFINQDTLIDIIRNLSNEEAWSLFANRDRPCKKRYLKLFRPLISYLFYLRCIQWIRGEETYGHLLDLQPKFRFDFHDFELNEIVHGTLDLEAFLSRCLDYFPNPLQEDFFSVFDYVRSNSNCHPTTVLKFQALTQAVGLDGPCYSQNMFIPIGCSFSCQE